MIDSIYKGKFGKEVEATTGINYLETDINISQSPVRHILNPKRATRRFNSSNTNGAIKISLPALTIPGIWCFNVTISGTTWNTNPDDFAVITLTKMGYVVNKTNNIGSDYTVRFGNDGVTDCVWIGELNQIFAYVTIGITNLFVDTADAVWLGAWDINRVQAFDTITSTIENNLPASDFNKLKNKPVGASGTFTTVDSKTVTVTDGIITSIV